MKKFRITVSRQRTETTEVEVLATTLEEARSEAEIVAKDDDVIWTDEVIEFQVMGGAK